jgi:hypothetical protein
MREKLNGLGVPPSITSTRGISLACSKISAGNRTRSTRRSAGVPDCVNRFPRGHSKASQGVMPHGKDPSPACDSDKTAYPRALI